MVLDKTGTITEGHPAVAAVRMAPGVTEAELLGLAASLEKASEHPLAEAIVRYAEEAGVEVSQATEFAAEAGQGVSGMDIRKKSTGRKSENDGCTESYT